MTASVDSPSQTLSSQFLVFGFICCIAVIFMTIACVQSKIDTLESRLGNFVDYQEYMMTFDVMFKQKMQGQSVSPFEHSNEDETESNTPQQN